MRSDSDQDRFGRALRAVEALRETLVGLGDQASIERADRLRAELRRRLGHGAPVVRLPTARERQVGL